MCSLHEPQVWQGPLLPDGSASAEGFKLKGWLGENPDKLNLAGLLNVLDGVVDCPNRVVVSLLPPFAPTFPLNLNSEP